MVTKGDLEGLKILNRPIKPVALGLTFSMLVLTVFNVVDMGVLRESSIGDVVSVMAGAAVFMFLIGWVGRSQIMAEAALFLAGMTMILRSAFLFTLEGLDNIGVWLGVGTAIVALGAFLLERTDQNRGEWWPRSSSLKV